MLPLPKDESEEIKDAAPIETPPKKQKAKKEKAPKEEVKPDGLIIYADAGARPNPGFGGWGNHGYIYSNTEPKRGNGCKYTHTVKGYVDKAAKASPVTPLSYVDAYGTIQYASNNGAEIIAATNALQYANKLDIKKVDVITDSKFVIDGVTYLPNKIKSNWIKRDGNPYSNQKEWLELNEQLKKLEEKQIPVKFSWVKGHNDDQGNTLADLYATIGVINSSRGAIVEKQVVSKPEEYWAVDYQKHPLLYHKRMFFTTSKEHNVAGEYYLSFSDSEADKRDLHGEKSNETSYSYLLLKQPDLYIESLRERILKEAQTEDALLMCRLETLFKKDNLSLIEKFGNECISQTQPGRLNLSFPSDSKKEPLVRELNPPRIAFRAVEAVNFLKGLLNDHLTNSSSELQATDITSHIYEIKDKEDCKIQGKFAANLTSFVVQVKYVKEEPQQTVPIKLTLGFDLPDRNTLKRLEKLKPNLRVITWRESQLAVRYAVIIEVEDAIGIWAGYYCNVKYLDMQSPGKP